MKRVNLNRFRMMKLWATLIYIGVAFLFVKLYKHYQKIHWMLDIIYITRLIAINIIGVILG